MNESLFTVNIHIHHTNAAYVCFRVLILTSLSNHNIRPHWLVVCIVHKTGNVYVCMGAVYTGETWWANTQAHTHTHSFCFADIQHIVVHKSVKKKYTIPFILLFASYTMYCIRLMRLFSKRKKRQKQ